MKTIEQFYAEIKDNEELRQAFREALESGTVEAFLKEQQVEATSEEIEAFVKTKMCELSDEELEAAVGGLKKTMNGKAYECTVNYTKTKYTGLLFLCPDCGRTVYLRNNGWRCDSCNKSWYYWQDLDLNLESGLWCPVK